jgi:phosphonate transport system substrate-binding protein
MKRHSANRTSAGLSWTQRTMMIVLAALVIFTVSPEIVQNATAAKIDPKLPPLKIAFIPFENPEQLVDNVGPAIAFLEKQLGRKIRHFTTLNYSSAVEALNAGKADISFMSPLPYVLVNAQTGAQAILGEIYNGKSYYHSKIFVRKNSGIKTLADLKGKTIAYVDPISSSGFMYPHDILIRAGLVKGGFDDPEGDFFRRVYYAGGDEQAMRALYGKFVDAAGVGEFSINLLRQEERDEIVEIAESARIPSHCVVARKDLDPKIKEQFIQAMLKLNAPENRKYVQYLYGTDGYVRVNKDTYRSVADMARKYGFMK